MAMSDVEGEPLAPCELLTESMTARQIAAVLEDMTHRVATEHAFLPDTGVCRSAKPTPSIHLPRSIAEKSASQSHSPAYRPRCTVKKTMLIRNTSAQKCDANTDRTASSAKPSWDRSLCCCFRTNETR
jgi:hypothetical protein